MDRNDIFKRYELKYLLTIEQYNNILNSLKDKIILDKYGETLISNIYYDTPNYLLIRHSLEKPVYKEKLRIRGYGIIKDDSTVFIELKKKYDGIVYKRRVKSNYQESINLSSNMIPNSQIEKEIKYFFSFYKNLMPKMYLSYERTAYMGKEDNSLRITFDTNILWRNYDLDLRKGSYGTNVINPNQILMEIKINNAIPMWLSNILTNTKANKTSFSKYGVAYLQLLKEKERSDIYARVI